jgi:hypothetical protein
VAVLTQPPRLDQPGMGMTNRVSPAQGEERGASFTLMKLDGDTSGKFQGLRPHFCEIHQFAVRGLKSAKTRKKAGNFAFPAIS